MTKLTAVTPISSIRRTHNNRKPTPQQIKQMMQPKPKGPGGDAS